MKSLISLLLCVILLGSCLTVYSRDMRTEPHETWLQSGDVYGIAVIKPWEQRTMREKYPEVTWNKQIYNAGAKKIDDAMIDKKLGSSIAAGIDELQGFNRRTINCEIYSVKSVSSDCVIAVKYQGYKGYYIFSNSYYYPETLGDFIADLNLKENLVINNKIYYSYWKDGVVASGNYVSMVYSLPDTSVIWDLLLSDTSVKNAGDKYYKESLMGISVDVKITGAKNISLAVNADGYLQTNILGTAKSFFIGKKKANEFVSYVKKHGTGKVLSSSPGGVQIEALSVQE